MTISSIRRFAQETNRRGQSLLIFGLMLIVLIGVVGLATDGAVAYAYSVSIERAAAASALAGVSYLPQNFNTSTPSASSRALDEAKRNGFDPSVSNCKCTVSPAQTNNNKNLQVTITQTVPTFFMQALGVAPFPITRVAEAGYRPPIRLGSPDNQFGSTVSQIGSNGQFYVLRHKAWHVGTGRAEGDAFTPDPTYEAPQATNDQHVISANMGNESTLNNVFPPRDPQPRGGQDYRVEVPPGTTGELQIYNAGFGPDKGAAAQNNPCENTNPPVCNPTAGQTMAENDGAQVQCQANPAPPCSGQKKDTGSPPNNQGYNSIIYSLFQVNDTFVRANDGLMLQDTVYPIDASNYKASPPTYVNVHTGATITQGYSGSLPSNMRSYHSWLNIGNPQGSSSEPVVSATGFSPTPLGGSTAISCTGGVCPALPPGSYRLRVDMADADGNFNNGGSSNHAFALRIVNPGTAPNASSTANVCQSTISGVTKKCTVSAWEDATVYTPVVANGSPVDNYAPIFQLPAEYAGSTINVDLYDFGDVTGTNDVAIIDPTGNAANACFSAASTFGGVACSSDPANPLQITDMGINRTGTPLVQHKAGTNSQGPDGAAPSGSANDVPHLIGGNFASWNVATNSVRVYNGTWIRVRIPIPVGYAPAAGSDFWYVRYRLDQSAVDTFSYAVAAEGGPVHLISS